MINYYIHKIQCYFLAKKCCFFRTYHLRNSSNYTDISVPIFQAQLLELLSTLVLNVELLWTTLNQDPKWAWLTLNWMIWRRFWLCTNSSHIFTNTEFSVGDHPFKTSANFFMIFYPYPPTFGSFLLLSVCKFGKFLTPPSLKHADVLNGLK